MYVSGFPVRVVEDGLDWPAWLQAVGSLVALAIAVGVPIVQRYVERRDKLLAALQLEVARLNIIGLTSVKLRWRPLSSHAGASATLRVLKPNSVTVARGKRRPLPHSGTVDADPDSAFEEKAAVSLSRVRTDPDDGTVFGCFFLADVTTDLSPPRVKIQLTVTDTATMRRVLRRSLWISPAY